MMRRAAVLALLGVLGSACRSPSSIGAPHAMSAAHETHRMASLPVTVPGAEAFDVQTGSGAYRVFVYRPAEPPPPAGYAALYVVDGNATFALAAMAANLQARSIGPLVVIGIGYPGARLFDVPRRLRDLTPPTRQDVYGAPPDAAHATGGNDQFLSEVTGPIHRAVAARLPLDPARRTVFGHSLGGLWVLHTLFQTQQAAFFNRYIAASPSIWWNDASLEQEADAFLQAAAPPLAAPRARLWLAVDSPPPSARRDGVASTPHAERRAHARMQERAEAMAQRLAREGRMRVETRLLVYPDETHISYLPAVLSRAVRLAAAQDTPASSLATQAHAERATSTAGARR